MSNIKNKLAVILSLVAILGASGCGNTSDPTSDPTTNDPTTTSPTTSLPVTDTSNPEEEKGVLSGTVPSGYVYKLGDQIYDFSFKDVFGETHTLSEELETKKVVILNFFASWCGPCASEFPAMQQAYAEYQDEASFFALSIELSDTNSLLQTKFVEKYNVTFPVGLDKDDLYSHFKTGGVIPVSVVIDRYGTITEVHCTSIPYYSEWVKLFERYTSDGYVQDDFSGSDTTSPSDPDVSTGPEKPVFTMPSSSEIEAVINGNGYTFGYYGADESDAEYNWPWLISEQYGAIYPSNEGVNSSYSIIQSDFTVTDVDNNILAFDYLTSCEKNYDILYVLIDGVIVGQYSGVSADWKTCYAYVPIEPGTYKLTLIYSKDSETAIGNDKVYVRNMRFISSDQITENMYIQRPAATKYNESTGKYTQYTTVVLNEDDGYYHINDKNGPLILAELLRGTRWSNQMTPYNLVAYDKGKINGVDYTAIVSEYASYATNNSTGLTPVNKDLKDALVAITNAYGDDSSDNQWQELCYYYSAYGPSAKEFPSPITGLTMKDAIKGEPEVDIPVTFDTILVPRGKYIEFIAPKTGAYQFSTDATSGTFGSVYNSKYECIKESTDYTYAKITTPEPNENIEMYAYLEEGQKYFLRIAFSWVDEMGSFNAKISYVGETYEHLKLASDSTAFTTKDEDFNIEDESSIISRNVPVELDPDGYYRHVREDETLGSYIYADLIAPSSMFFVNSKRVSLETVVKNGGAKLEWYNELGVVEKTEDLTADFEKYIEISKNQTENTLIPVNEELAHLLQRLMDYYTFNGVEGSWMKLCFYYDYIGPSAK